MNTNPILFFDFETTDKYPETCEITEIAAKCYNGVTLEPFENGEFKSLVKPLDPKFWSGEIGDDALRITGITREELKDAPHPKVVWGQFVTFVERFNKKKDSWNSPIASGANIRNFDIPIANRYNKLYGPKKEATILFNTFKCIDLMDVLFMWFEGSNSLQNFKNETLRDYFGYKDKSAHRAMTDVLFCADLIIRFLRYHRRLNANDRFKDAFAR